MQIAQVSFSHLHNSALCACGAAPLMHLLIPTQIQAIAPRIIPNLHGISHLWTVAQHFPPNMHPHTPYLIAAHISDHRHFSCTVMQPHALFLTHTAPLAHPHKSHTVFSIMTYICPPQTTQHHLCTPTCILSDPCGTSFAPCTSPYILFEPCCTSSLTCTVLLVPTLTQPT